MKFVFYMKYIFVLKFGCTLAKPLIHVCISSSVPSNEASSS